MVGSAKLTSSRDAHEGETTFTHPNTFPHHLAWRGGLVEVNIMAQAQATKVDLRQIRRD